MTGDVVAVRGLSAAEVDPDRGPRRTVAAMVGVVLLFLVCAVVWALVAQLDVAVQARGAVIPPSRLQEVQSLEGGIVQQLLVAPGQAVKKGQLLARLDTAQYTASVGESRQNQLAALAGRARVDALLAGTVPRFDPDWQREAPELIAKESQLWRDALQEYQANGAATRKAKDGSVTLLARMGSGDLFGLLALIDEGPRSASCTAMGEVIVASLPRRRFEQLYNSQAAAAYTFQYMIARQLVRDVRATNEALIRQMLDYTEVEVHAALQNVSVEFRPSRGGEEIGDDESTQ